MIWVLHVLHFTVKVQFLVASGSVSASGNLKILLRFAGGASVMLTPCLLLVVMILSVSPGMYGA